MPRSYHVGTSGWNYETFIGTIYDKDTPKRRYLETYCQFFDTVELNASFYRSFTEKTWQGWYKRTPNDFYWSVKAPRFITHIKRLNVDKESIDMFFNRAFHLKEKLAVVLFQLPPSLKYDPKTMDDFLDMLPKGVKIAIEARNRSWFDKKIYKRLEEKNIAWVISHSSGRYPMQEVFTADFVYLRLHGTAGLYRGAYGREGLKRWVELLKNADRDGYVYFDNTADGSAVKDALLLKQILSENVHEFST